MSGKLESIFIERIKNKFNKGSINVIILKSELPDGFKEEKNFCYEPDIVIENNGKITHVIEVESDPVRKSIVGAAFTCAYFLKKNFEGCKPYLYFAIGKDGEKQLPSFNHRKKIIEEFIGNSFSTVKIEKQDDIYSQLCKDLGIEEN